jgi:hypothetical protein
MARENRGWGYDRIVGALANLGHAISDRTVGNILRRHNLDRDQKFCREFRETLAAGGVQCLPLPARNPNLKDYASYCTS